MQKPGVEILIKQKLTFPDALPRMGQGYDLSAKQHLQGTSATPARAGPALGKAEQCRIRDVLLWKLLLAESSRECKITVLK